MNEIDPEALEPALREKLDACRSVLRQLGRVVVAYSGGADSTLLLALALETLGRENVLAVTAVSTIFPQRELATARRTARGMEVRHVELQTNQLTDPHFTSNPTDRCYYCKTDIFGRLKKLAAEEGFAGVVSGANASDVGDYRPGLRAEKQLGIGSPLLAAGMTKQDIRAASRAIGLDSWRLPAMACLATRVPYGEPITEAKVARIDRAEETLRELGFAHCRVRDHETVARVEVPADQTPQLVQLRDRVVPALKALGYTYVALDLEGYRTGAMNEAI